jgi:hypothetical protein
VDARRLKLAVLKDGLKRLGGQQQNSLVIRCDIELVRAVKTFRSRDQLVIEVKNQIATYYEHKFLIIEENTSGLKKIVQDKLAEVESDSIDAYVYIPCWLIKKAIVNDSWKKYYNWYNTRIAEHHSGRYFQEAKEIEVLNGCNLTSEATQLLTGKGQFEDYLHQIGRIRSPICRLCLQEIGTIAHHLEVCRYKTEERQRIGSICLQIESVDASNLVDFLASVSKLIPTAREVRTATANIAR